MTHYMMDCFFHEDGGVRTDSRRIVASSDDEAIRQASTVGSWDHPTRFEVRVVTRGGSRVVYKSNPEPPV